VIIIFGWLKEKRAVKTVLQCYCYVCQRESEWAVLRETEWVTLFAMKTLPFLSKESLACRRCGDEATLDKAKARELLKGASMPGMIQRLEAEQLASKSEVQRNFLLSARVARGAASASVLSDR